LHKYLDRLVPLLGNSRMIIYDQNPHHAFMDDSPYKGVYQRAFSLLNIENFAVSSKYWSEHVKLNGMPSKFVKMWILPEYCNVGIPYVDRKFSVGFVGSMHPYRKEMINFLQHQGIEVYVHSGNSLPYNEYMSMLSNIKIYVHNEHYTLSVEGKPFDLGAALWQKDIEITSRGCFSVRNYSEGSETYLLGVKTLHLYDKIEQIPEILKTIQQMDAKERQSCIESSVKFIRESNEWEKTARILCGENIKESAI
jgi:hypothetical protein